MVRGDAVGSHRYRQDRHGAEDAAVGPEVFLSDDMTILDSSGVARSFPKPLTISHHTLQSVNAGDLGRWEWTWLKVQSRLHSKEGRGFALKLATHNVPIMTINSWTQRAVPPPKYSVQRLVPCEIASSPRRTAVHHRARVPSQSAVPQSEAIAEMLVNTEDAYGFPPYRYLSQALSVDGISYEELKERERLILVSAMESVQFIGLAPTTSRGRIGSRPNWST